MDFLDIGTKFFTYSVIGRKYRLKASPKLGIIPKELPDWLNIPYLCLFAPQDWSIRCEGCANPTIRGAQNDKWVPSVV